MQNERGCLNHYNVFVYIQDFEIVFLRIVGAFLVYEILDNDVYLDLVGYYKFFLLVFVFD